MGREGHEPTMVLHSSSSIALLQERFRRLQRAKQMREERELMRGPVMHYDPASTATLFFHPELMMIDLRSTSPPPQVALSLWPNDSAVGSKRSASDILMRPATRLHLHDDIDTSLHL